MYQVHKFMLTPSQLKKIKKALDEDKQCSLTIPHDKFNGDHPLPVTEAELKHVHEGDGYVSVSLSKKKLQHIRDEKEGGFLGLLKFLPGIVKGALAISTLAGAVNKNKAEEEKNGGSLASNKSRGHDGDGEKNSYTFGGAKCGHCGGGLMLKAKRGKGIYLKPYNGSYSQGDGLITGIASAAGAQLPPAPSWLTSLPIVGSLIDTIY